MLKIGCARRGHGPDHSGVTSDWRSGQARWITYREGSTGPMTFTISLRNGRVPESFYVSLAIFRRWLWLYWRSAC